MLNTGVAPAFAILSLKDVPIPEPTNLHAFVKGDPAGTAAEQALAEESKQKLIVLGKALFWDMQVGSDNVQACASCHFNAGADPRPTNQLNPMDDTWGNSAVAGVFGPNDPEWNFRFGPNMPLSPANFPFHLNDRPTTPVDPANEAANTIRDTNDVVSSQGVREQDLPAPWSDGVFNWMDNNQRRVEPRNAPSMINAVFHVDMFWDGRASFVFNGVNPFGFRDRDATVSRNLGTADSPDVQPVKIRIPFAAHASQSVGPPLSNFEMSGVVRSFPDLADKLLDANPLALQVVHPDDSVLGPYAKAEYAPSDDAELTDVPGMKDPATGDDLTYRALIQDTFRDEWWNGEEEQFRRNFTLFFGLAMQAYQGSLVADDTPFDRFMGADADVRGGGVPIPPDPTALTAQEQLGLDIFQGTNLSGQNPGLITGGCVNCHILPETSNHTLRIAGADPAAVIGGPTDLENVVVPAAIVEAMPMGAFVPPVSIPPVINPGDPFLLGFGLYDVGFYNIGVRPTAEDLGRKSTAPPTTGFASGLPLSYVELARMKQAGALPPDVAQFVPDIPAIFPNVEVPLADGTVQLVDIPTDGLPTITDGAFKVPTLRNQEFQGPYFHNGGEATLRHVVEFYVRGGNFPGTNAQFLDADIAPIPEMDTLVPGDEADQNIRALVAFLSRGLTDPRVKADAAPFDHPQLVLPEGANGRTPGSDRAKILEPTGANGGNNIPRFLGLDPQTPGDPEALGTIEGRVVEDGTDTGLIGIEVTAHRLITDENGDPAWQQVARDYTDATGAYSLRGVIPGSYKVRFFDEDGTYVSETYLDAPFALSSGSGQSVDVAAAATTADIDASLAKVTGDSFETDDDMLEGSLVSSDTVQARTLDRQGDHDWVRIDGRTGNTYVFETSGGVPLDTLLELYDIEGTLLRQNDNGGDGAFSRLTFTATDDAPLYLRARGRTSTAVGAYSLSVSATDVTPPETTSDAVATYHGSATIALSATDDWSGVESTRYRLDDGAPVDGTSVTVAEPGTHTLVFSSRDNAGNQEADQQVSFEVLPADTTAPVTISDAVAAYTGSATITLSAADEPGGSGVATTLYRLNGGEWQTGTQVVVSAAGLYTLEFYSTDNAGNAETPTSVVFAVLGVDTTPPMTMSDAEPTYVGSATITLTAADEMSGVASTHWRINGSEWSTGTVVDVTMAGSHTLEFYSVDNAGNEEAVNSVGFTISEPPTGDTTPPVTTLQTSEFRLPVGATVSLTATDGPDGSGVAGTYWRIGEGDWVAGDEITFTAPGAQTVEFYSVDAEGNEEQHQTQLFDIFVPDTTAPVTTSDAVASYEGLAEITLSAHDDGGSGLKATYWRINGGEWNTGTVIEVTMVGSHTLEFYSVDNADNEESVKSVAFEVLEPVLDTTPPASTSNAQLIYTGTATIDLFATDEGGSGVKEIRYSLDGGLWTVGNQVVTNVPGAHVLEFSAVDNAGNTEAANTVTFTVIAPDLTAPVTTSDAVDSYESEAVITLSATDAGSGVSATYWRLDGGPWQTGTTVSTSVVGDHTLEFFSEDAAGNQETPTTVTFTVVAKGVATVDRADGQTRFDGSVVMARQQFPNWDGVTDIVIASGEDRAAADPLAAAGLCGALDAPLFLVGSRRVDASVKQAVKEIAEQAEGPVTVHIVGGTSSVPDARYLELASAVGASGQLRKERVVAGGNRYDLAAEIARTMADLNGSNPSAVLIANGADPSKFFDALALSPIAASKGYPVLLVSAGSVPPATRAAIAEFAPDRIIVGGGERTVSPGVLTSLGDGAARWAGTDRYTTALVIADKAVDELGMRRATVGIAAKLPDALTGGACVGMSDGVLALTESRRLTPATGAWLAAHRDEISAITIFGGPLSIHDDVADAIIAQVQ